MNGLYALKPWYTAQLGVFTRWAVAKQLSPDVFTVLGVAAAMLAAATITAGWWLPTLLLLGARLAGANLDGAVARARGVSRPWGFVLNEIGDRLSDLLMFTGLAALAVQTGGPVWMVAAVAVTATLPTFASLAAAGAGATRTNGGPFGKTERCAATVVVVAVPHLLTLFAVAVVAGSVLTAALRLKGAHRELASTEALQ